MADGAVTDTSALRAFIEARLAEDERLAQSCTPGHPDWHAFTMDDIAGASVFDDQWRLMDCVLYDHNKPMSTKPGATGPAYIDTDQVMVHAARHDPARVLREVAAKRAILARHHRGDRNECVGCGYFGDMDDPCIDEEMENCPELVELASVWSDHPDYDPSWSTT